MPRQGERTDAEDYLEQLQWEENRAHKNTRFIPEPKWKYKIVRPPHKETVPFIRNLLSVAWIALGPYLLYLIIIQHSGAAIYFLVIYLIVTGIMYFAIRDISTPIHKDDDADY